MIYLSINKSKIYIFVKVEKNEKLDIQTHGQGTLV